MEDAKHYIEFIFGTNTFLINDAILGTMASFTWASQ